MSKAWIPNICTSLNLVFGILAIFMMIMGGVKFGPLIDGPICILLALAADGLDGRLARYLGTANELGKEMDSLCDVVSFGTAPGVMSVLFTLSVVSMAAMKAGIPPANLQYFLYFSIAAGVIYAVCGMWRLARFNINAAVVHGYFMGLPIPAGGCIIATATMLIANLPFIPPMAVGYAAPVVVIILGLLMVSRIHYPDFKGTGERINVIALIISLLFALGVIYLCRSVFPFAVLFAIFSTYAVLGILNTIFNKIA
jgi:CDP-diacylglycerol--serine O-phosphatidyltransferase